MRALSGRSRISYPLVIVFNLLRKTTKVCPIPTLIARVSIANQSILIMCNKYPYSHIYNQWVFSGTMGKLLCHSQHICWWMHYKPSVYTHFPYLYLKYSTLVNVSFLVFLYESNLGNLKFFIEAVYPISLMVGLQKSHFSRNLHFS
jgi:hypothetical protein